MRRLKTYTAQSGYVYQYYYEGHRPWHAKTDHGTEYVFTLSADGKHWDLSSVVMSDRGISEWQAASQRELSSTERYAVAKMALFQAFDERADPGRMKDEVRVRPADIAAIIETLGL